MMPLILYSLSRFILCYQPEVSWPETRNLLCPIKMPLYYAGLNPSSFYSGKYTVEKFTEIPFTDITDVYIDWNYLLLWRYTELWITGTIGDLQNPVLTCPKELKIPDNASGRCLSATGGVDNITILTSNNEIWRYKIYEKSWKKVPRFIPLKDDGDETVEKIVKMDQGKVVVALTNLGRVFNVPALVEMPEGVKFIDISCGLEHTLMLAENGDVYSMGLGTRGQLGHCDLEDSDEPKLVEALAGLKVSQISAAGWCSAAVVEEGDLYVWGWNNEGQLGLGDDQKVVAVPTVVDFKDECEETLELRIVKVQCTSSFVICLTDNGELWGCGSNKYGQMGQDKKLFPGAKRFMKIPIDFNGNHVEDFKCRARGTLIFTSRDDR
ncbi:E3 ubiquitin-protein ligase HERC2 [Venturia canescens]|uniref:E3 ubiquitin-protein ligase HERC2 n=1 Tax=Venturia canescens TaxID=32260 RepID=UPI001C9CBD0E|nr:E3 ubiquitin-protein ligase HERC2 [Venturia canescens]